MSGVYQGKSWLHVTWCRQTRLIILLRLLVLAVSSSRLKIEGIARYALTPCFHMTNIITLWDILAVLCLEFSCYPSWIMNRRFSWEVIISSKEEIMSPSEVLVSSDVRPSNDLTFKGFSLYNQLSTFEFPSLSVAWHYNGEPRILSE